jgi:hypothetical protein
MPLVGSFNDASQRSGVASVVEGILDPAKNQIARVPFNQSRYSGNRLLFTTDRLYNIFDADLSDTAYLVAAGRLIQKGKVLPSFLSPATASHMIAPTIRINKTVIGTDKLEHLFQQGYWYWYWGSFYTRISQNWQRWAFGQYMEGAFRPVAATSKPNDAMAADYDRNFARYWSANAYRQDLLPEGDWMAKKFAPRFRGMGDFGSISSGVISYADMYANEAGYWYYRRLAYAYDNEFWLKKDNTPLSKRFAFSFDGCDVGYKGNDGSWYWRTRLSYMNEYVVTNNRLVGTVATGPVLPNVKDPATIKIDYTRFP